MTALAPIEWPPDGIERALAVGAHPDDCEFSAGGTLACLVDAGVEVVLCVVSDGRRGGRDSRDMKVVRYDEQTAAAKQLGVARVERLARCDGEVVCDDALREDLVRRLRADRPDLILTHDPRTLWRRFGSRTFLGHTDHRATGQAVLDALYPRAGNANFFPEQLDEPGLELWTPLELWLFDSAEPDSRVAIEAGLERKLLALAEHESQSLSAGGMVDAARRLAAREGRERGDGTPIEVFARHRLRGL